MVAFDPFGSGPKTEAEIKQITGKTSDQITTLTRQGHRRRQLDRHTSAPRVDNEPGQWGGSRRNGGRRGGHGY